jgi:hypothetical protein
MPGLTYDIVAWTAVGLGALLAILRLAGWARGRPSPGVSGSDALGRLVSSGVPLIAVGLAMVGASSGNTATVWVARLLLAAALVYVIIWWLRTRALRGR